MNGLLQRLVSQAQGAKAARAPARIRAAASVHALAPMASPTAGSGAAAPNVLPAPQTSETGLARVDRGGAPADAPTRMPDDSAPRAGTASAQSPTGSTRRDKISKLQIVVAPTERTAPEYSPRETESALPTRLLEKVAPALTSPFAVAPTPPVDSRQAVQPVRIDNSEPNEVHVHIGRIEVTTVTESEKPKINRDKPPRQTRSLADYLAGRSRT